MSDPGKFFQEIDGHQIEGIYSCELNLLTTFMYNSILCTFRELLHFQSLEYPIKHLLPPALPPLLLRLLIIHRIHIRLQIHLRQLDRLGPLNQLPGHIHDQHDWQLDVVTHKVHAAEFGAEAAPALHQNQEAV